MPGMHDLTRPWQRVYSLAKLIVSSLSYSLDVGATSTFPSFFFYVVERRSNFFDFIEESHAHMEDICRSDGTCLC